MKTYRLTLYVDVFDKELLAAEAAKWASKEGFVQEQWANVRIGAETDLVILLEPELSPPGCEITESSCELCWSGTPPDED